MMISCWPVLCLFNQGVLTAPGTVSSRDLGELWSAGGSHACPSSSPTGAGGAVVCTWLTHMSWQLSYRAREIFSTFLCSKATTPVNIDSQAQLADDILSAPHPDMFKEQQLQVSPCLHCRGDSGQAQGRGLGSQTASSQVPPGGEGRSWSASWGGRNCPSPLGSGVRCGQPDPGSQGRPQ